MKTIEITYASLITYIALAILSFAVLGLFLLPAEIAVPLRPLLMPIVLSVGGIGIITVGLDCFEIYFEINLISVIKKMVKKKEKSTLVLPEEMLQRAAAEGVDVSKISSIMPRWAESKPFTPGVKSALVRCDLIVRSDNSVVGLDGMLGIDSVYLAQQHMKGETNPKNLPWDKWVKSVSRFPSVE